jgi:uncharacterized damage-inducible protein DinB
MTNNIDSILKLFQYYKSLGDKTFEQLSFKEMQIEFQVDSNSISIIVKHIVGNMLSRWTNFLTEDGEKKWRERDQEFIDTYKNKEQLLFEWDKGWQCLFDALNSLTEKDLEKIIYIRNQVHTVAEAVNRQMAHYAYHIGQIVLLGKQLKGNNWNSLSIPKGKSIIYNKEKFDIEKGKRHFTEDL